MFSYTETIISGVESFPVHIMSTKCSDTSIFFLQVQVVKKIEVNSTMIKLEYTLTICTIQCCNYLGWLSKRPCGEMLIVSIHTMLAVYLYHFVCCH